MATDLQGYLTCVPLMGRHSLIIFKNKCCLPICDANIGGYAHWKGAKYVLHMVWCKHIHLPHLSFIAGCAQINKIYFPNFSPQRMQFQATTLKMWVNTTINQWENQLNWIVTKRKFYTRTYKVSGPYFDIGVTHKCILVMHTSAWWIINILRGTLEKTDRSLF